jgi:hypothetical protein
VSSRFLFLPSEDWMPYYAFAHLALGPSVSFIPFRLPCLEHRLLKESNRRLIMTSSMLLTAFLGSVLGLCGLAVGYLAWLELREFLRKYSIQQLERGRPGLAFQVRALGVRSEPSAPSPETGSRNWTASVYQWGAWRTTHVLKAPSLGVGRIGSAVILSTQTRTA